MKMRLEIVIALSALLFSPGAFARKKALNHPKERLVPTAASAPGEVLLYHVDGSTTKYKASEDTDAARGAALLQAEAASLPAETIAVGKGSFELPSSLVTKSGQTIVGAGVDVTNLRWAALSSQPTSTAGDQLVGNNYFTQTDGVTVRGMTIDCNAQNHVAGIAVTGVILNGSNCLIEDIKVINAGRTDGGECFSVALYSGESTAIKTNSHIRRVEVTQSAAILWRSGLSCILIGGVYDRCSIEDCYVHDIEVGDSSGTIPGKPRYVHAFGMSGSSIRAPACTRGKVVRNRAVNLTGEAGAQGAAIYTDTGSVDDYEIADNRLINVLRGIHLHEGTLYRNVKITRNKIRFLSEISSTGGVMLTANKADNCIIARNDIREQRPGGTSASYAIAVTLVTNLTVRKNLVKMANRRREIYIDHANKDALCKRNRRVDGSAIRVSVGATTW